MKTKNYKYNYHIIECPICDNCFTYNKNKRSIYCSLKCLKASRRSNSTCITCGKQYSHTISQSKYFCSTICSRNYLIEYTCIYCGEDYTSNWDKVQSRKYCSSQCAALYIYFTYKDKRKKYYKSQNYKWKHSTLKEYALHYIQTGQFLIDNEQDKLNIWKYAIQQLRGMQCQKCGTTEGRLCAHHVKSRKQFPQFKYDLNNGIILCNSCHAKEHDVFRMHKKSKN